MEEYEYTEHWMQRIVDRLDRLIEIGESLEGQVRLPSEDESKTFSGAKDPAKEAEPEHPADPKTEPGEGYRPVNDGDIGRVVEVQNSVADPWRECTLLAIDWDRRYGFLCRHTDPVVELRWCFARIKNDEPAKEPEPEHPPDPGEGYRILSKNPPEELMPGDEYFGMWDGLWRESRDASEGIREQRETRWYRRKIEAPKPAWEPKVGDWVRVTRPVDWIQWKDISWRDEMHAYDGKVFQVVVALETSFGHRVKLHGIDWFFHRDWLSPADEPAKEPEPEHPAGPMPDPGEGYRIVSKDPPEDLRDGDEFFHSTLGRWRESIHAAWGYKRQDPDCWYRRKIEQPKDQYRQPVLPADAGEQCEFSDDGQRWLSGRVYGWVPGRNWVTLHNSSWKHARIKKDA